MNVFKSICAVVLYCTAVVGCAPTEIEIKKQFVILGIHHNSGVFIDVGDISTFQRHNGVFVANECKHAHKLGLGDIYALSVRDGVPVAKDLCRILSYAQ